MASSSPPVVVKGQGTSLIAEICSSVGRNRAWDVIKRNIKPNACACICVQFFRCSSGKIMQNSRKTNRIDRLTPSSLHSWHSMSAQGRRGSVLGSLWHIWRELPIMWRRWRHWRTACTPPIPRASQASCSTEATSALHLISTNSLEGLCLAGCHSPPRFQHMGLLPFPYGTSEHCQHLDLCLCLPFRSH